MGEYKFKVIDVVNRIGLNRNIIFFFYKEIVVWVDLDVIDRLCDLF